MTGWTGVPGPGATRFVRVAPELSSPCDGDRRDRPPGGLRDKQKGQRDKGMQDRGRHCTIFRRCRDGGRPRAGGRALAALLASVLYATSSLPVLAHTGTPPSLQGVVPPEVPGLLGGRDRIVRDRRYAIALGKALFWDIQVGSDGVACATCHHQAGADVRAMNQLSPGRLPETRPTAATFQATGSGQAGGPNTMLLRGDFPLHRLANGADITSMVQFTTDDVVGSAGTYGGAYRGSPADDVYDDCARTADAVFHVGALGTRKVTSRNAPSVINAALNRRLFWDGRASNRFNGVNNYGDRDVDARVWVWNRRTGTLGPQSMSLENSPLASQAVTAPLDSTEMSCSGRTFADIGRKLLRRRPLQYQSVHETDSVLGKYRDRSGQGLKVTYQRLVEKAFDRRFWSAPAELTPGAFGSPAGGGAPFTQEEANFSLFFGLAIQLYESTLVSDQSPFDQPRTVVDNMAVPQGFTQQQQDGLKDFLNFHCSDCHGGATLSGAGSTASGVLTDVDRKPIRSAGGQLVLGLTDAGFMNTGVVPREHDPGLGIDDPYGNPVALAAQFRDFLSGATASTIDTMQVKACAMTAQFSVSSFSQPAFAPEELVSDPAGYEGCVYPSRALLPTQAVAAAESALPGHGRLLDGNLGAFRVPTLRNVELTGPYMHNGSMASLEEVVEFYNRGGNFLSEGKDAQFLFSNGMSAQTRANIVAFLKTLTDERVRWEKAPFDHPSLPLPVGHSGDATSSTEGLEAGFAGLAQTEFVELPAVGAEGRDAGQGALQPFADQLAP